MAHFDATVRVYDVVEADSPAARRLIEERLRTAGFSRWQVVTVGPPNTKPHAPRPRRPRVHTDVSYASGGLLVAAVTAWALWFLWLLAT